MKAPERSPTLHIGRNIARMREMLGVKQETLAHGLGISQQAVSKLEQSVKPDETRLEEVAHVLGITANALRYFNEEAAIRVITDCFNDESAPPYPCHSNPLARVIILYEALLKEKDKKIALLEMLLASEKADPDMDRQHQWIATLNHLLVTMITNHQMIRNDQGQLR